MRRVVLFAAVLFVLSSVFALEANAIDLNVPPSVSGDFNVVWDVNAATNDWNIFVVATHFGTVRYVDGWYSRDFNVGVDYNASVSASSCEVNSDTNIMRCSYEFNWANVLRNGDLNVTVIGYDSEGNEINAVTAPVRIDAFSEYNAVVSAYVPSGEWNVLLSFDCNISDQNTGVAGFILHSSAGAMYPSSVYVSGDRVTLRFDSNVTDLTRGAVLELNSLDINAIDCNFAPDTNVLIVGFPDAYMEINATGWQPFVFPHEIDVNYEYTRVALRDANAYAYVDGNRWELTDPLADSAYLLRGYLVYSDHNILVPIRDLNKDSHKCTGEKYVDLHAGWSLIPVYCDDNSQSECPDVNSTLYTLSFLEFNATLPYIIGVHPFYAYIAGWNATVATAVTEFGQFTVRSGALYWVWIPDNWLQAGLHAHYYGRCIKVPTP
ncbi:MAG: hypothetical protein GXN93_02965 [Candidatus Diapherotrites archaeon]|nr:hypothetical protein [Candidatus Diapherotrites archaeon]